MVCIGFRLPVPQPSAARSLPLLHRPGNTGQTGPYRNPLASTLERAHCPRRPRHPPRESCGPYPAAEGATGPRKRSGKKDRDGQGSLESRTARKRGVRTDGVRGCTPESLRYRDRGGSSPPASRRWMALSRRLWFGPKRPTRRPHTPAYNPPRPLASPPWGPHGAVRRLRHAGAI
jgi:hypothetical protein